MPGAPKRGTRRHSMAARATCGAVWLAALVLCAWAWQLRAQLSTATTALNARVAQQAQVPTVESPATKIPTGLDFTQRLPMASSLTARAHTLIESTQREARVRGVQWLAVTSAPQPASGRSLSKLDVSLTLQGSYPQVKAVLADALSRTPAVVFKQLELRRAANGGDVEAQLSVMLVGRPAAGDGS